MILQNVVLTIWIVGASLIALGFIFVIVQSRKPADDEERRKANHTAHVLQGWLFAVLVVVFVVGSWATLRHFPIPPQHGSLDAQQTVDVVGRIWSWQLTPDTIKTGSVVEFRVTSVDVNHGFAIYAPDGRIVTQTQAMPGYTNKLLYTFTEPGTYTVQCLEYCGIGHAPMHTTFTVVTPEQAAAAAAMPAVARVVTPVSPVEHGKELAQKLGCVACHAATDKSGVGPGWGGLYGSEVHFDDGTTATADDAYITQSIRDPTAKTVKGYIKGAMPPFGEQQLSDADLEALIAYIRSLKSP